MKKTAIEPVEQPYIRDISRLRLIGTMYYGDPFHSSKPFSYENEIGKTWNRFFQLYKKNKTLIEKYRLNKSLTYEIHMEPEKKDDKGQYYVFIGIEVKNDIFLEIPFEMFGMVLPPLKYLIFSFKGDNMYRGISYVYREYLPSSNYNEVLPFLLQVYCDDKYFGLEDPNSILDYYIPIQKIELNEELNKNYLGE